MQETVILIGSLLNKCERPGKFISGSLTLFFFLVFFYAPLPVDAICDGETERSLKSAESITFEWPLRPPNDSPTRYLQALGERLIQNYRMYQGWFRRKFLGQDWPQDEWRFFMVKDLSPNAFSIGNGRTYITDGTFIFVRTEAELAAILAHEISHQLCGHFCYATQSNNAIRQPLGSLVQVLDMAKEVEADELSLEILMSTGFPPSSMLEVVKRLPENKNIHQYQNRLIYLNKKLELMDEFHTPPSSDEFLKIKKNLSK